MKTIERDVPFTLYLHVGLAPLSRRRNDILRASRGIHKLQSRKLFFYDQHQRELYYFIFLLILIRVIILM